MTDGGSELCGSEVILYQSPFSAHFLWNGLAFCFLPILSAIEISDFFSSNNEWIMERSVYNITSTLKSLSPLLVLLRGITGSAPIVGLVVGSKRPTFYFISIIINWFDLTVLELCIIKSTALVDVRFLLAFIGSLKHFCPLFPLHIFIDLCSTFPDVRLKPSEWIKK